LTPPIDHTRTNNNTRLAAAAAAEDDDDDEDDDGSYFRVSASELFVTRVFPVHMQLDCVAAQQTE